MIIGLIGKKRSGKDTLADYLVKNYGFVKYSFGDPVKEISKIMFDLSQEQLDTNLKEEIDTRWNLTPREIFQTIGTEFGREFLHKVLPHINVEKEQFWIRKFTIWYNSQKKINKNLKVVIADVRFINEYKAIENLNGVFITILRNNLKQDNHISENEIHNHIYENEIHNIKNKENNYFIENNDDINTFFDNFKKLNLFS